MKLRYAGECLQHANHANQSARLLASRIMATAILSRRLPAFMRRSEVVISEDAHSLDPMFSLILATTRRVSSTLRSCKMR